jgi:hypothetical protein
LYFFVDRQVAAELPSADAANSHADCWGNSDDALMSFILFFIYFIFIYRFRRFSASISLPRFVSPFVAFASSVTPHRVFGWLHSPDTSPLLPLCRLTPHCSISCLFIAAGFIANFIPDFGSHSISTIFHWSYRLQCIGY